MCNGRKHILIQMQEAKIANYYSCQITKDYGTEPFKDAVSVSQENSKSREENYKTELNYAGYHKIDY